MLASIIDGKKLAWEREQLLKIEVEKLTKKIGRKPKLVAVELADDEGSRLYLKLKKAAAERIGIEMEVISTPKPIYDLRFTIYEYKDVDGIFVQHPKGYEKQKWQQLVDQIPPEKDVDCLTSENLRLIKERKPRFLPATVKAVGYCLLEAFRPLSSRAESRDLATERSDTDIASPSTRRYMASLDSSTSLRSAQNDELIKKSISSKPVVILGRSPILGLPLFWWLKNFGVKVTLLHSQSMVSDLRLAVNAADILISAVGKPGIITGDMVKSGVIVIDCGSPLGDVVFNEVAQKAAAITPVPGGVGPLTVVSLMENVVKSAKDTYAKKRR